MMTQHLRDLPALADSVIALVRQATPWVAGTVASAAVTKGVEELWDLVKRKLTSRGGEEAIEKATAEPYKVRNWDTLRNLLVDALEADEAFRARVGDLMTSVTSSVSAQTAIGDGNKQGSIQNSPGSSINF